MEVKEKSLSRLMVAEAMEEMRRLDQVVPIGPRQWLVPSRSSPAWRLVGWDQTWSCSCPFVGWARPDGQTVECPHVRRVQAEAGPARAARKRVPTGGCGPQTDNA